MSTCRPTVSNMQQLIENAGLTNEEAAKLLKVSIGNLRKWLRCKASPPHSTVILLRIMAEGIHMIPGAGTGWKGWRLQQGVLYDPSAPRKHYHTPGSIRVWHWLAQKLQMRRAEENIRNRDIESSDSVVAFPGMETDKWRDISTELYQRMDKSREEDSQDKKIPVNQPGNEAESYD